MSKVGGKFFPDLLWRRFGKMVLLLGRVLKWCIWHIKPHSRIIFSLYLRIGTIKIIFHSRKMGNNGCKLSLRMHLIKNSLLGQCSSQMCHVQLSNEQCCVFCSLNWLFCFLTTRGENNLLSKAKRKSSNSKQVKLTISRDWWRFLACQLLLLGKEISQFGLNLRRPFHYGFRPLWNLL